MASSDLDRAIADIAANQHDAFARRQILAIGGTQHQIDSRIRSGRWERVDSGVYRLSGRRPTWRHRAHAATLNHPEARLSGPAASALHGFLDSRDPYLPLQIAVPPTANSRSALAQVRRSGLLTFARVEGIPVVTPAQAFIDMLPGMTEARARAVLEHAIRSDILTADDFGARAFQVARSRIPAIELVRSLVDRYCTKGATVAPSELQRLLIVILDEPGMPEYEEEAPAPWRKAVLERVDVHLPASRTIVEADGRRWHAQLADMDNDRRRDNEAAAHGYAVLRFSWTDLRHRPGSVRRQILETHAHGLAARARTT